MSMLCYISDEEVDADRQQSKKPIVGACTLWILTILHLSELIDWFPHLRGENSMSLVPHRQPKRATEGQWRPRSGLPGP